MSEIQPALTPDQWAEWKADGSVDLHTGPNGSTLWLRDGRLQVADHYDEGLDPAHLVALANAALPDDDPRKIRREHIEAIDRAVRDLESCSRDAGIVPNDEMLAALTDLADALESYLPPEV